MVSDRREWISLKFIWHMTSNKTQVEFKKIGYLPIWKEYLSLVHDVLVLFMFFLMADFKLCYRQILRGYLVSLAYCHFQLSDISGRLKVYYNACHEQR